MNLVLVKIYCHIAVANSFTSLYCKCGQNANKICYQHGVITYLFVAVHKLVTFSIVFPVSWKGNNFAFNVFCLFASTSTIFFIGTLSIFGILNMKCTLSPICLYLLTFTVVLPLICCLLPLRQSVYYQLLTSLYVLLKPDTTLQMDNELITELFAKNAERLDVANRFIELQQLFVMKNVSVLPLKYVVKSYPKVGPLLAHQVPARTEDINSNSVVTVAVVVISAGRDVIVSSGQKYAPGYLTQNVARFIALIGERKQSDRVSYQLLVCSVGDHATAEEHSLGRLVPLIRDPQQDSGFTFGPFHDLLAWRLVVSGL